MIFLHTFHAETQYLFCLAFKEKYESNLPWGTYTHSYTYTIYSNNNLTLLLIQYTYRVYKTIHYDILVLQLLYKYI